MVEHIAHDFTTTLNGAITDVATSLTLTSSTGAPIAPFRIRIDDEIILVGARSGTACSSLSRGQEGTSAAAHSNGATIEAIMTAFGLLTLPGWHDVRAYGAVGDGTTDDSTAIQAAIDAAIAEGPGGEVWIPPGTWNIGTTGLTIGGDDVHIRGAGKWNTLLNYTGTGSAITNSAPATRRVQVQISDIGIAIDNATAGAIALHIDNFFRGTFRNIKLYAGGVVSDALRLTGSAAKNTYFNNFTDLEITTDGIGIHFAGSGTVNRNSFTNVNIDGTNGKAIVFDSDAAGNGSNVFINVAIEGMAGDPLIDMAATGEAQRNLFVGLFVETCPGDIVLRAGSYFNHFIGYSRDATSGTITFVNKANFVLDFENPDIGIQGQIRPLHLTVPTKAGVPVDGDAYTGIALTGDIVLDETNSRIYFRVGSTWKYAALAATSGNRAVGLTVAASDSTAKDILVADSVGDGTADNVEIQAAIDSLEAAGGGTLRLAEGAYDIAAGLVVDTNVPIHIVGYGAVLNLTAGITGLRVSQGISNSRGVTVEGIRFSGGAISVSFEDTNNSHLVRCELENATTAAWDLHSNVASNFVEGCTATDCTWRGNQRGIRTRTTSGTGSFMQTKVRGAKIVVGGTAGVGIEIGQSSLMLGAILEGSIWIGTDETALSLDGNMEDAELDFRIEGEGGSTGNTAVIIGSNASNVTGTFLRFRLTGTINTTLTNTGAEDFIYDSQRNVHVFSQGTQVEGWRRHGDANNRLQIELLTAGPRISYGTGGSAPTNMFTPSRGGTIINPRAAINVIVWRAPFPCTVTNIRGYRVGGTGATINARRNNADNHLSSALSLTNANEWMDGGAVQNTAYVAGDELEIMIVSVTGSPDQVAIQVEYTRP